MSPAAVRLDERILPALQPHVDRMVKLEYQFDEQLRKATYAEELSRRWVEILSAHADDQDIADARDATLTTQKGAARWITEPLRRHSEHPTDPSQVPPQQSRPSPAPPPESPPRPIP
ncbi:hypothetical protein [Micromonospora sp. NPDC047527]|uniref:hypothetical protein n=1 Tax=Micromonospora sp. NPDC047527 TaxID=3155144 RepID=UPI0033DD5FF6